jgi:hypothetical protein
LEFPESINKNFSKEEIDLLNEWREKMKNVPIGRRINDNFEKCPHVPGDIWLKFLKNLIGWLKKGKTYLDVIRNSISDDMLLQGPGVNKDELDDGLTRLMDIRTLKKRYLKDNIPVFTTQKGLGQLCKFVNKGSVTIEKNFKKVELRGKQPIVWATFVKDVDDYFNINDDIDDLCDKLGLTSLKKNDHVIRLGYESTKIKKPRIPTVLDGGDNPAFYPSDKEDDTGYTWDLKNKQEGFPEIVHEPIPFQEIQIIHCLGRKNRDASPIL